MANDLGFLKVWANANKSKQTTKRSLSEFLKEYDVELSLQDSSTDDVNTASETKEKPTTNSNAESTTNIHPVFKRYNIDPTTFSVSDLQKWAEEHNHTVEPVGMRTCAERWLLQSQT